MSFTEQVSRNSSRSPSRSETDDGGNYYAFFGKPVSENLAANRSGILTAQQQDDLDRHVASHKGGIALVAGMCMCVVAFAFFIFWKADGEDGVRSFENIFFGTGAVTILAGLLTYFLTGDWFVFFARDDLEGGVVESAAGKVVWGGRRYQMRTDTRQLRSLRHSVSPPPGEYRFYYLPHTGLVVMAEESRNAREAETTSALFRALASANAFSFEDLTQNQKGLLSRHQENRLIGFIAFYGLALLGSGALLAGLRFQILHALSTTTTLLLFMIGAFLLLRFGWALAKIAMDIWHGRVSRVDGLVARETRRSRYRTSYYYVVDSFRFEVSEAAYNALNEGLQYRIWYVPRSKRMVSIEPV